MYIHSYISYIYIIFIYLRRHITIIVPPSLFTYTPQMASWIPKSRSNTQPGQCFFLGNLY